MYSTAVLLCLSLEIPEIADFLVPGVVAATQKYKV